MSEKGEKGFFVRLPTDLLTALKEFSEKNNIPQARIVEDAIRQYLSAPASSSSSPSLRQIITKFAGKCTKCGKQIDVGEIAYWAQGILICIECYYKASSHIGDAKKALKAYAAYKRYKVLALQAQKELDELITKINVYETYAQLGDIVHKIDDALRLINEYLLSVDKSASLEEAKTMLIDINNKLEEILAARTILFEKKKEKIRV